MLQFPEISPLQRASGQQHLWSSHCRFVGYGDNAAKHCITIVLCCRLHQTVPGPHVGSPGAATLPALRARQHHVSRPRDCPLLPSVHGQSTCQLSTRDHITCLLSTALPSPSPSYSQVIVNNQTQGILYLALYLYTLSNSFLI